jgi:uncharacterized protein (DUF3084 family)
MTKPGDSQTKKTIHELAKEFPEKTYRELEKYRDADRQEEALGIGGIGHNQPPDLVEVMAIENEKLKKESAQLQNELDRVKKEKNDLFIRIAELIETNEKEVKNLKWIKDHDYIFLVDENKKLHKEVRELKEDNKKLSREIEDRIARARKAGM